MGEDSQIQRYLHGAPNTTMDALYTTERTAPGRSVLTEHIFPFAHHSLSGHTVLNLTTQWGAIGLYRPRSIIPAQWLKMLGDPI